MSDPLKCICGREVEISEGHIYCTGCGLFMSYEFHDALPLERFWRGMVTAENVRRSIVRAAEPYIQAAIVGVIEMEVEDER